MLTDFALLTVLTLNSDERAVLRDKIDEWLKCFLPKLERETTRSEKCTLISSVERHEFGDDDNAEYWRFCKFDGTNGTIFDKDKDKLENFKLTSFQKRILRKNPDLKNVFLGRFEINEENGEWNLNDELERKIISEGGEALIFSQKFGNYEVAVRIQVFDSFLFTPKLGVDKIKWKTHLISGKIYF